MAWPPLCQQSGCRAEDRLDVRACPAGVRLASTSVGGYAGAVIMDGLRSAGSRWLVAPVDHRRAGVDFARRRARPTRSLIISQVILSFGIPFALIPLVRIAADRL